MTPALLARYAYCTMPYPRLSIPPLLAVVVSGDVVYYPWYATLVIPPTNPPARVPPRVPCSGTFVSKRFTQFKSVRFTHSQFALNTHPISTVLAGDAPGGPAGGPDRRTHEGPNRHRAAEVEVATGEPTAVTQPRRGLNWPRGAVAGSRMAAPPLPTPKVAGV